MPCVITPVLAGFAVQIALCISSALIVGKSLARRSLAAICLLAALALPFFLDTGPLVRGLLTYIALLNVMKVTQIVVAAPSQFPWARRIWSALAPFDVRRTRREPPAFAFRLLIRVVAFAVFGAAVYWFAVFYSGLLSPQLALAAQLATTVIVLYAAIEAIAGALRFLHRLAGIDVDPIQRDPILSRSVAEFWGERWNLPVSQWLNEIFFRLLARRGRPLVGMMMAFLVSALFHAWLLFAAVDLRAGLLAGSFFLLQVPAIILERRLRIRRWPVYAAHAWTLVILLASSPLLTLPLLRGLEMQLAGR